jgi:hypothetical protein
VGGRFLLFELLVERGWGSARGCARGPRPDDEDYAERNAAQREFWESMNGKQAGDRSKLAQALLTITAEEQPPLRLIAGSDALAQAEQKLAERQQQIDAFRGLSSSLAFDEAAA